MTIEQQLRLAIKEQLTRCNAAATPKVCNLVKTIEGYRKVENLVIQKVINDQLTPDAAVGQIEAEL